MRTRPIHATHWWAVWLTSFGTRESMTINRKMVKYCTMTRTFDITKSRERLGYRPLVGNFESAERSVKAFLTAEAKDGIE
ncbi:hypothetical protein K458DRAFT_392903 [Lentithecium fluviatile CBS 122367]|uniref:3-beta hydroxysteroid dehydrogenase/isomerase domain-containing protein n=1 Tax=Lentithecium fluviatile CBS 122367 TaxID=1168545 RepID=A0A6G1IR31_9PLEO|nr:hypothetical protein K458DRAFT_392903 [Lentithecium fluviatile CBS 122367]